MSVANPVAQRGPALSLGPSDELTSTTEEPPDLGRLHISDSQSTPDAAFFRAAEKAASSGIPASSNRITAPLSNSAVSSLSSSLDTSLRRANMEVKLSPIVPPSPSMAESTGGSASDYEHEPDSPSSMSSWNSWAGGRRGDLADVEDLELDGITVNEPELETVSEMDEESSGFVSGSDRAGLDSDEDATGHLKGRSSASSPRRKLFRLSGEQHTSSSQASLHPHHPHYHHHASHLHPHGTPIHPHFSPRAGGHGLSHASRHLGRAPPNVAARRRKGRLAELAEEGSGGSIVTTKMPAPTPGNGDDSASKTDADKPGINGSSSNLTANESSPVESPIYSGQVDNDFEMFGPPPLPVRSVSPSETIPVIPSPLCVCLTADEQGGVTEVRQDTTPTRELMRHSFPLSGKDDDGQQVNEEGTPYVRNVHTPTPSSPGGSGSASIRSFDTAMTGSSSPPSTPPPTSPQLVRKTSLRSRRSSSPVRTKPKVPLRPCFKRRGSTQTGILTTSRETSSSDLLNLSPSRGRNKVRFSQAPPIEVRTHSPVDYDRKACPVSNRLSPEDLEELRQMKMEMGLLEAKCAALAACKQGGRKPGAGHYGSDWTESESESDSHDSAPRGGLHVLPDRRRADSISSSSPTTFCRNRFGQSDNQAPGVGKDPRVTPAEYLRMEREKERERVCRMAGIGTGVGFRYTGGGPSTRQMPHGGCQALGASSLISRFGLSKPPPPLPGMRAPATTSPQHASSNGSPSRASNSGSATTEFNINTTASHSGYSGGSSLYRPNSAPPTRTVHVPDGPLTRGSAFPQQQPSYAFRTPQYDPYGYGRADEDTSAVEELPAVDFDEEHDDEPQRGRSMDKGVGRGVNHNSTSTDATLTEADVHSSLQSSHIPSLTRTCPSPPPSSSSSMSDRDHSLSPRVSMHFASSDSAYAASAAKPIRPGIRPISGAAASASLDAVPLSSSCGYDSPASEFCYESGSEYDLLG